MRPISDSLVKLKSTQKQLYRQCTHFTKELRRLRVLRLEEPTDHAEDLLPTAPRALRLEEPTGHKRSCFTTTLGFRPL